MRKVDCLIKATIWFFFSTFFGLMALWVVIALASIGKDVQDLASIYKKLVEFLRDGGIMVLCLALIGAVWSDFVLFSSRRHKAGVPMKALWFIGISPLFVVIWLVLLGYHLYNHHHNPDKISFWFFELCESIVIVFAIMFCFIVKTFLFTKTTEA